jgi:D-glycero-D-manno-heptose 1,7-bisphosphate phosphatase
MKKLKKAIFLDRDGVINDNSIAYYIHKIEDFRFNPGVLQTLKHFTDKGFLLVVITNQGGIARKQYTCKTVEALNQYLINTLKEQGILLTDIFYCPHHTEISKCLCRKPGSLMLEKAIALYGIDTAKSYMIGDSVHDISAAEKLGIKGIKVPSNQNLFEEVKKTAFSYLLE